MKLKFMKHTTLSILAAAVTIALASCEKTPVEPENPTPVTPIDNPTYSSGIANQLVEFLTNEQGDTTAFQISYTSWMEVDGEKVSVPLKVYYRVLDTTFYLSEPSGRNYEDSFGNKRCSDRSEGAMTIVDSAMYVILSCDEYSFELECRYETAVCNIGSESQSMPHLRVRRLEVPSINCYNVEYEYPNRHIQYRGDFEIFVGSEKYDLPFWITEVVPLE